MAWKIKLQAGQVWSDDGRHHYVVISHGDDRYILVHVGGFGWDEPRTEAELSAWLRKNDFELANYYITTTESEDGMTWKVQWE